MKNLWLLLRTAVYGALFLGLTLWWLPLRLFERRPRWPVSWDWLQYVGILCLLPAVLVMLGSAWQFVHRGRGTPAPFDPPTKFVRRGPYKWVRNPLYLALFTAVGGEGFFFQSQHIGVYWVCLVCAIHLLVVLYEENSLRMRFGAIYEDYKREVPRWLPRKPRPMLQTVQPFEAKR